MKRLIAVFFALFFSVGTAFSLDFGFLIDQKIEAENELFTYTPSVNPWFSWNGNNGMSVYLSAILPLKIEENGCKFIPEISRFSFGYQINKFTSLEAGRVSYSDLIGFTATGLFDGVIFKTAANIGSISAGVFYTGLQYKETAKVIMTDNDTEDYLKLWDWGNGNDYFASRRALASFRWDMPFGNTSIFSFEVLAQFDLNNKEQVLNSQYGMFQFELFPVKKIKVTAGAIFEMMQNENGEFGAAFGVSANASINLPTVINDKLSIKLRSASGSLSETFTPFKPVTLNPQGDVFTGTMAGLTVIGVDYSARIIESLYADCAFNYFIRTFDNAKGGYGGEIFASAAWQPLEDMRFSLGAGVFLPQMGNIYSSGKALWKIVAGLALSL